MRDKSDLKHIRQVQEDEANHYATKNGLFFIETSALENHDNHVGKAFEIVVGGMNEPTLKKFILKSIKSKNKINLDLKC